jgi:hypothetical protein
MQEFSAIRHDKMRDLLAGNWQDFKSIGLIGAFSPIWGSENSVKSLARSLPI